MCEYLSNGRYLYEYLPMTFSVKFSYLIDDSFTEGVKRYKNLYNDRKQD